MILNDLFAAGLPIAKIFIFILVLFLIIIVVFYHQNTIAAILANLKRFWHTLPVATYILLVATYTWQAVAESPVCPMGR
jgi:hypothetical protein